MPLKSDASSKLILLSFFISIFLTYQSNSFAKSDDIDSTRAVIGWCNLQWPSNGNINPGTAFNVYARVWADGVTNTPGPGAGIQAWIGISSQNTNPSGWAQWLPADYNSDYGNNDEYFCEIASSLQPGIYYYASRFKLNSGPFRYGGFSSTGGGYWDGTVNVSGKLIISSDIMQVFEVNSQNPEPVYTIPLPAGSVYRAEVSGTYSFWPEQIGYGVDARYLYQIPPGYPGQGLEPIPVNQDAGLVINGQIIEAQPHDYNEEHIYSYFLDGNDQPQSFLIRDYHEGQPAYSDNSGSLIVTVTRDFGTYIRGKVIDAVSGQPVPGADVRITGNGGFNLFTVSKLNGDYGFYQLTNGNYNLSASAGGFLSNNINVVITNSTPVSIDIELSSESENCLSITSTMAICGDSRIQLQPDYYKITGNVNINDILFFDGEVTVDMRPFNAKPVLSSSGRLRVGNIQGNSYDIIPEGINYQFSASGNTLNPKSLGYIMEIPYVIAGFPMKMSGITFAGNNDAVYVKIVPKLPYPLDLLFKYEFEAADIGDFYEFLNELQEIYSGSLIFSKSYGKQYQVSISLENKETTGGIFAIKNLHFSYDSYANSIQAGFKIKIPDFEGDKSAVNGEFLSTPVELKYEEGDQVITTMTTFEEIIAMQKAFGLPYLEMEAECELINGHLDMISLTVGVKIPLFQTGLFITELGAQLSGLNSNNFTISGHLDIETVLPSFPVVGTPVKLNDLGVTIKPFNSFSAYGEFQVFNHSVSNGSLEYLPAEKSLKADAELDIADMVQGGMHAALVGGSFQGSALAVIKTPSDLPPWFQWLADIVFGSAELNISNAEMSAMTNYLDLSLAHKFVFGKTGFPYFHYFVGTNFNNLLQIWKGQKGDYQQIVFSVPENTAGMLIVADNGSNLFDFEVISPSDSILNSSNTTYFQSALSKQTVMYVKYPEQGDWTFSTEQTGSINVYTKYPDQEPSTLLLQPQSLKTRSNLVELEFTDYSDTIDVDVFYDTDRQNFDGRFIKRFSLINNANVSFEWQNDDIPDGEYFIYCSISDRKNAAIMQYSSGSVLKDNTGIPVPSNINFLSFPDSVVVNWQIPPGSAKYFTNLSFREIAKNQNHYYYSPGNRISIKDLIPGKKYIVQLNHFLANGLTGASCQPIEFNYTVTNGQNRPFFDLNSDSVWFFVEGEAKSKYLAPSDFDNDPLLISILQKPANSTVAENMFTWTPGEEQIGYSALKISVSDGTFSDTLTKSMYVYSIDEATPKLKFSSFRLYENDNKFLILSNIRETLEHPEIQLINQRTGETQIFTADKISSKKFMASIEISSKEKTKINVIDGDKILAKYYYDGTEFTVTAIYDQDPQNNDITPPGKIADLSVSEFGLNNVILFWTATGDDFTSGEALYYDLRYSYQPILSETDFLTANMHELSFYPSSAGNKDSLIINLSALAQSSGNTTVYFSIKARDEMGNSGELGNSAGFDYLLSPVGIQTQLDNFYNCQISWINPVRQDKGFLFNRLIRKIDESSFALLADSLINPFFTDSLHNAPDGIYTYGLISIYDGGMSDTLYSGSVLLDRFVNVRIFCSLEDTANYSGIEIILTGLDSVYQQSYELSTTMNGLILLDDVFTAGYHIKLSKEGYRTILQNIDISRNVREFIFTLTLGNNSSNIIHNINWNLISVPLNADNPSIPELFPSAISSAFMFDNGYIITDTLYPGTGVWLKFASAGTDTINGAFSAEDTVWVNSGWNLIGFFENNIPVSSIGSIPADIVQSQFYGYNNSYHSVQELNPGNGYWVKTSNAGALFSIENNAAKTIHQTYDLSSVSANLLIADSENRRFHLSICEIAEYPELPPLPPALIPDVRFGSNSAFSTIKEGEDIFLQGLQYPVRIKSEAHDLRIYDPVYNLFDTRLLRGGEFALSDERIRKIRIELLETPGKFKLEQNYPNPFNPETKIGFSLPENANVVLEIYSLLGEKILTVFEKDMDAGTHEILFNGSSLASGIYFYSIKAKGQSGVMKEVRKMAMLK